MLLDPLEHEIAERLAAAGDRARSSDFTAPDRAFSADLRDRLMTAASDRATDRASDRANDRASDRAGDREHVRVAWSLPSFFRVPRMVPVLAATLLLLVGVAAARELYVAIGNGPDATPTPSVELVAPSESAGEPSFVAVESAAGVVEATPDPTIAPTVKPTVKPTAQPTAVPTPGLVAMDLSATGCNGGVVLTWSMYDGDFFNHYTTLRNTTSSIPKAYPPQGGAVDPGGTYTTHQGKTSAVDTSAAAGTTYYYRTMAFDAGDGVIGASAVVSAVAAPVGSLGSLGVTPDLVDGTDLAWTTYGGSGDCFTWYKLVYSETSATPSYLDGDPYLAAISDSSVGSYVASSGDLQSGHTYFLRVQAIRATDLGLFIVAQTDVATYLVP